MSYTWTHAFNNVIEWLQGEISPLPPPVFDEIKSDIQIRDGVVDKKAIRKILMAHRLYDHVNVMGSGIQLRRMLGMELPNERQLTNEQIDELRQRFLEVSKIWKKANPKRQSFSIYYVNHRLLEEMNEPELAKELFPLTNSRAEAYDAQWANVVAARGDSQKDLPITLSQETLEQW